jgi:hypothetical protein
MGTSRVFVSYHALDSASHAHQVVMRLVEALSLAQVEVVEDNAAVADTEYVQYLNSVLPSCQWLIVVQTPEALQSLRVQMSVSTALHLVNQQKMRNVLLVAATLCDPQAIPITWESLTVFDATQDYARALARVLLELDLQSPQTNAIDSVLTVSDATSLTGDNNIKVPVDLESTPLPVDAVRTSTDGEDRPLALSATSNTRGKRTPSPQDQFDRAASLHVVSKSRGSKNSPKRLKGWVVVTLAVLLLIVITSGGVILYFVRSLDSPFTPATARVTITPTSSDLKNTFNIAAVTGTPDISKSQVEARILSSTLASQSQVSSATGQGYIPATRATGTLTFDPSAPPMTVPAGTIFTDSKGIEIETNQSANLPYPHGGATPVTVSARAVNAGSSGNIRVNDINQTYELCCEQGNKIPIIVYNTASYTGGQDAQNYPIVQQSDINNSANVLIAANTPNPQQVMQAQIRPNEQLTGTPQCKPDVTSDHAVGDRATRVTVSVSFTCTGEVYDHDGAMALAANLLRAQASSELGSGFALAGKITTTLTNVTSQDSQQKGIGLTVAAQGLWVYQFSDAQKQAFAKLIVGKSKQQASGLLLAQTGVAKVDIQIPGSGDSLPVDVSRVIINIPDILRPSS